MDSTEPLSNTEWQEICDLALITLSGWSLSTAQKARADSLGKRMKISRPRPAPIPPGTLYPAILIPVMNEGQMIASDPGVGGAPVA